jgi:hypothetical protein
VRLVRSGWMGILIGASLLGAGNAHAQVFRPLKTLAFVVEPIGHHAFLLTPSFRVQAYWKLRYSFACTKRAPGNTGPLGSFIGIEVVPGTMHNTDDSNIVSPQVWISNTYQYRTATVLSRQPGFFRLIVAMSSYCSYWIRVYG